MKKLFSVLLAACILAALPACTPYKELKELSIVEGMALDKMDGGVRLTFQIYDPQGGSGGGQSGQSTSNETIIESSGKTIYDAMRNATLSIGKKMYFPNTRIIIVSEAFCKEDFASTIDMLNRAIEIRPSVKILVSKGTAAEILTAKKDGKLIAAKDFETVMESYSVSSKVVPFTLEDLINKESDGITDIALAAVETQKDEGGNDVLVADGTAILRKGRFVSYMDTTETRGMLWALGKVKSGIIVVSPSYGGKLSMEITSSSSKISSKMKGDEPSIEIDVSFTTNVDELGTSSVILTNGAQVNELALLQDNAVKQEISSAINTSMRMDDADIYGFGMKFFENQPEAWKKISTKWAMIIKTIPVTIHVTSNIAHTGMITQ
ncbi:MAG: Ger(x)C family spore germination protein [Clostridia bacterium]|nr:Ger(x)C family spore germination protein [Clostridia bacterium]